MNKNDGFNCRYSEIPPMRGDDGIWKLRVMLPNGSCNSEAEGRVNTSALLKFGGVCPEGYGPEQRDYFPVLPSRSDVEFIVGRPQDAPYLASKGYVHCFIACGDVVLEASEAGIGGTDHVLELPFATVDVVMAVSRERQFSTIAGLLASVPAPVRCITETPFLARKAFRQEGSYRARFGSAPPALDLGGIVKVSGNPSVTIIKSAGSCEPQVSRGFYDCAVVVRSSGGTIKDCGLKVIKHIGTFHPGLFCLKGLDEHPVLGSKMRWLIKQLEAARQRWQGLHELQPELPFADDVAKNKTSGHGLPEEQVHRTC